MENYKKPESKTKDEIDMEHVEEVCAKLKEVSNLEGFSANISLDAHGGDYRGDSINYSAANGVYGGLTLSVPSKFTENNQIAFAKYRKIFEEAGVLDKVEVFQKPERARGGPDRDLGTLNETNAF